MTFLEYERVRLRLRHAASLILAAAGGPRLRGEFDRGEHRTVRRRRGRFDSARPRAATAAFAVLILTSVTQLAAAGETLVEVRKIDPTIQTDVRYATENNFMKEKMYTSARVFLRPQVAARLVRVQKRLAARGYGLKIFDGYRPLSIQKKMFAKFPLDGYVMDPKKGSNHNRGAAVDVTLVDKSGTELPMPSAYDEFTERAHVDYEGGPAPLRENRRILQDAMKAEGFKPIRTEWWHFDDPDKASYSLLDIPIETLP